MSKSCAIFLSCLPDQYFLCENPYWIMNKQVNKKNNQFVFIIFTYTFIYKILYSISHI